MGKHDDERFVPTDQVTVRTYPAVGVRPMFCGYCGFPLGTGHVRYAEGYMCAGCASRLCTLRTRVIFLNPKRKPVRS